MYKNNPTILVGLFFFHFFENLCEKYSHSSYDNKKDNFPDTREKYCSNSKNTREKINNKSNLRLSESEFHESEMKMMGLISFHRILSFENTCRDNIDKINEIYSQYRYCCSNLSSCNYRECCNQKCEHNGSRISHDQPARDIASSEEKSNRDNDCE